MNSWSIILIVAPILDASCCLYDIACYRRAAAGHAKAMVSLASTIVLTAIAVILFAIESGPSGFEGGVYLVGNWAPFGIVLVLDGLSAMMLLLTALLAVASLVFSFARAGTRSAHFHSMFNCC